MSIASILLAVAGMSMRLLHAYTVEEGTTSAAGETFPLGPSASQAPTALTIQNFASNESSSSLWSMTCDLPVDIAGTTSSDTIPALMTASPAITDNPSAFRAFLQTSGAGVAFSTHTGYSVLFFADTARVSALLNVEWWDESGFRYYIVSFHSGLTSSPIARYSFCEPLSYTQTHPIITTYGSGSYKATLPDPSIRYALNAQRLARSITDPVALNEAISALDRDGGIFAVITSKP